MKKTLFLLLWIGLATFQFSNAQENNLEELIDNSEATLQTELSWEEGTTTVEEPTIEEANLNDVDDVSYNNDEFYYDWGNDYRADDADYQNTEDFNFDINEQDISKFIWIGLWFIWTFFICRLIGFIFWIRMLVDYAKYQKNDRVGWLLVLVFFNVLWALIYLFAAKIWRKQEERLAC